METSGMYPAEPGCPWPQAYPPQVQSAEQRRRWCLASGIAVEVLGEQAAVEAVWLASRVIYDSPWPTE